MILAIAIVLSIGVALARGGKFGHLQGLTFRCGWLVLVALAIQIAIFYLPGLFNAGLGDARMALLLASNVLLIAVVALNLQLPGLWIMAIGLGLNLAVMAANRGYMPVAPETLVRAGLAHLASGALGAPVLGAKDILLTREATRLWVLSDILTLPRALGLRYAFSMGDVVLALGAFVLFQRTMRQPSGRVATAPTQENVG